MGRLGLGLRGAMLAGGLLTAGCQSTRSLALEPTEREQIQAILERQAQAWNRGDLTGFLSDYEDSAEMTFSARGELVRGRDALEARYRRSYPDPDLGQLTFSELEFQKLGPDTALVLGVWSLDLPPDRPHGRFTLVVRRGEHGYRILHDHSSAVETED